MGAPINVDARMLSIGDHGIRADAPPDADLHLRHQLVAHKTHQRSQRDPFQILQWQRIEQPLNRFNQDESGAEADGNDDEDAGDIFQPPKTIGEALVGRPPRKVEGE